MEKTNGFIALTPVIVIGGLIFIMTAGMAYRAKNQVLAGAGHAAAREAQELADGCAEAALMKLQETFGYAGNETLNIGGRPCDILLIEGSGTYNRTIKTKAGAKGYTRRATVIIGKISFPTTISSWIESE